MRISADIRINLEVISCPRCGIHFALPVDVLNRKKELIHDISCPNGHPLNHGPTEKDKKIMDMLMNLEEFAAVVERRDKSIRGYKGQITRIKNQFEKLKTQYMLRGAKIETLESKLNK